MISEQMVLDDLEVSFLNPGQSDPVKLEVSNRPNIDDYIDRAKRIQIKHPVGIPHSVNPLSKVTVAYRGETLLVGFIDKLDEGEPQEQTFILKSAEGLLNERTGQLYRYPAGTPINSMLSSSAGGSVVGLLFMANSLIPKGSFIPHSGKVYKLPKGGTNYRLGNLSTLYQDTTSLVKVSGVPTSAGRFGQDSEYLYIWCTDGNDPDYHLILAPNYKDTYVRLGTIEDGSTSFTSAFEIGNTTKLNYIIDSLILGLGKVPIYKANKDGYVYLSAAASVGEGSSSVAIRTFEHGLNCEITSKPTESGYIQCLIGQGAGSGWTQNVETILDLSQLGTWRELAFTYPSLYGDVLRTAIQKMFDEDYQEPIVYQITAPGADMSLAAGDWIEIKRPGYAAIIRQIKYLSFKTNSIMKIEAGQRLQTIQEMLQGKQEILDNLYTFQGSHSPQSYSFGFGPDNVDTSVPLSIDFELKSSDENGTIDPDFPYRVLLTVTIGWYKSNSAARDKAKSHSGVGGHKGYGGGGGGSGGGGQSHSNKTTTSQASSNFVAYLTDIVVVGEEHGHGLEMYYEGEHWHVGWCDYAPGPIATGDAGSHAHPGQIFNDYHTHGLGKWVAQAAAASHTHPVPVLDTDYSNTPAMTAQERAGSATHEAEDADLIARLYEHPVASLTYLTLAIKCNNVAVPGSPFAGEGGTGLYIGDTIESIDITELVTVGGKNTLWFKPSEYGGSDVVRCAISGNVTVQSVISFS